ncbi:Uncharacterised protein [Yersinia aldovae]|uniref:hypothetical protein n=1 Tax=Yersinia aldovae TaxID=29483 RepID=UPI0005E983AD|nr:hypothetical protein [Yersinia aldovae]CNK23576.1 Uncharacterised protein [Yersinia aldovae]
MTISMINSTLKMAAALTDAKPVAHSNNVQQRVAQAWQGNPAGKTPAMQKQESAPQFSAKEQSAIDDFVESLRTTEDKKALFGLLNKKLMSLSSAERVKFLTGLNMTIKNSEVPGDDALLKEKFNPAYAMYIGNGMLLNQMKEEVLSKMGKVPDEDDEDPDEI